MNQSGIIKGFLYSANETSIKIIDNKSLGTTKLITIESINIDVIKWRRNGNIKRGLGHGAIGGTLFGVIVRLTSDLGIEPQGDGDDLLILAKGTAQVGVTIGTAFAYGIIGGGLGTGFYSIKKKAVIKGNKENYAKELPKLKQICIK